MNVIGFKGAKCKNCYKCVRVCEVKAICVKDEQAQIIHEKCIYCGHCLEACPQNAKTYISDLDRVKQYIKDGEKVVISLAPSYKGVLKFDKPGQVITALLKLGFFQVRETAEGAVYVSREYERLMAEGEMDNIITTCCPSANKLVEIYYPDLVPYMAPVVSPMIAHGRLLKKEMGSDIKVVFLGPCISKKSEAESDPRTRGAVDAVINFTELEQWMSEEGIAFADLEETPFHNPNPRVNRLYPVTGGILTSVMTERKFENYRKFYVHGIENCIELLRSMQRGEVHGCFIEINVCNGGCIKGPAVNYNADGFSRFKIKLDMQESIPADPVTKEEYPEQEPEIFAKPFMNLAPEEKFPSEQQIREILAKTGKLDKKDELNCGACGYSSCREKAIAVFQGKAELTMCIPYMHEKAQSMANTVLDTTPNVIIVADAEMRIVEFSHAAEIMFHKTRQQAMEMFLFEFIDPADFEHVLQTHENIHGKKVTYDELGKTTLQNIIYIEKSNCVMGTFQDVTMEEEKAQQSYKLKVDTIEMAQNVIDKQMKVAQEIAGLLGETTAETKVTLTQLRDMILFEGDVESE
ncbi:[Fe-Fe] hydrogenase large subunit C-terminal domain-containing protein [Anaerolentibacter hominis]|uniref:[Fe-Fe] hydrogenase large subunit C-terminal domain-containing protein n=1 Tax=Anaerolentibacter hominis TaxID=3079009 RepID=UPI0031B82367